jgi:hypothetical protein
MVDPSSTHELSTIHFAVAWDEPETADLLRKHGGKTKKELEAAGN